MYTSSLCDCMDMSKLMRRGYTMAANLKKRMIPPEYCYATHAGKCPKCDNGCYEGCTCMQKRMRHIGHDLYSTGKRLAYLESDYKDYARRNACHRLWELNKDDSDFQAQQVMFRNLVRAEACGGDTSRRTYLADGTVLQSKPRTHPQVYRSDGSKLGGLRTTLPSFEQFNCHLDCNPPVPCSSKLTKAICVPPNVRQGSLCCKDLTKSFPFKCPMINTSNAKTTRESDALPCSNNCTTENADVPVDKIDLSDHSTPSLDNNDTGYCKCCTPTGTLGRSTSSLVESNPKYDAWRRQYLSRDPKADKKHQWFMNEQQRIVNSLQRDQNQRMDMWGREEACLTTLKQMADEKSRRLKILERDCLRESLGLQHDRDPDRTRISKNLYFAESPVFEVRPATTDLSSQPSKARFVEYREAARTVKTLLDNTVYNPRLLSNT